MNLYIKFTRVIGFFVFGISLYTSSAISLNLNHSDELFAIEDMMIAYYPLDGDAIDYSGNGNDGTINGAVVSTDYRNQINKSLFFDGINDTATLPSLDDWGDDLTLSFWVNSNANEPQILIGSRALGSGATLVNFYVSIRENGTMRWLVASDGANSNLETNIKFPINQWVHVITDFSTNSGEMNIYWNGELITSGNVGSTPRKLSNTDIGIGGFCTGCGNNDNLLSGQIDELRIHNRILINEEITSLAGITADYRFENNADDSSLNLRHGTVYDATPTAGVFDDTTISAYAMDGISNVINTPSLNNWGQELGFSLWFKPDSNSAGAGQVLIGSRQSGSGSTVANFVINITPSNEINWKIYSDGLNSVATSDPGLFNYDQWNHLICDWSQVTDDMRIFLNGQLVAISNVNGTPRYLSFGVGLGNYNKGFDNFQAPFHGIIDQVKIMSRVFTDTEVLELADVIFQNNFED